MSEVNTSSSSSNSASDTEAGKVTPNPPTTPPSRRRFGFSFFAIIIVIFLILGGTLLWYFKAQQPRTNGTTPGTSQITTNTKTVKLIIGTDPTLPPMEYIENGTLAGYDIDFANFIGKELGTEVEFKNIGFDDLFTALEQKKIDIIISAVTITDERKLKYDFSDPYLNAGQVIITKKTTTSISLPATLAGKKVGVQQGTTNESEALKYTSEKKVVRFANFEQAAQALELGTIDAMMTDLPNARGIVGKNKDFKIAGDPFTFEYYGITLLKGNDTLKAKINTALASLQQKGILEDLKQKWFE
jgi:polar amino acid transport system substrate-binding protein